MIRNHPGSRIVKKHLLKVVRGLWAMVDAPLLTVAHLDVSGKAGILSGSDNLLVST